MSKWKSFINACNRGNIDKVKELLKDPSIQNILPKRQINRALVAASTYGHADIVKLLLQDGRFDPSYEKNWAIEIACENGHEDVVELLLQDERTNPSNCNCSLKWASKNGHIKVVEMLLQDGRSEPTADNQYAIKHAKTDEIRDILIAYKYRVDGSEYQKAKNEINL
jgi:ankyrin repeat protein